MLTAFNGWRQLLFTSSCDTAKLALSTTLHDLDQLKQKLERMTIRLRDHGSVSRVFHNWTNEARRCKKAGLRDQVPWQSKVSQDVQEGFEAWSSEPPGTFEPAPKVMDIPKDVCWKPVLACEVIRQNGPPPRTRKVAVHQVRYLLASVFHAWWSGLHGSIYYSPHPPDQPPPWRPGQNGRSPRRPKSAQAHVNGK